MIPKVIHYCWFGHGEKPKLAKKCILSWKRYCPDYKFIEWNEENFDINLNAYTKMCYAQKKYAFLTDYIRLLVIAEYGGIYFDTDVELLRSFDGLLDCQAFFGFENNEYVNTGVGFGAEAGNEVVLQMIREYDQLLDGEHGVIGCPHLNTDALLKRGLVQNGKKQRVDGAIIYPIEYFNPYDDPTGVLTKTECTYSIHWYGKSWMDKKTILRSKLTKPLHRFCKKWKL
ncbi:glycosyl transferase [Anaerostipes sp. 992a]|uniref:glycosyltransferase family 32 protein n=1 Tax=Anaerostipes sp. 992a TaxID=1261637 RepID=UPI000950BAAF|nr:glycosyltransferase [Anaerostipes sp. 992a]OLR62170.1 glycosyl transferase [Anaerostipes sp. 992a]